MFVDTPLEECEKRDTKGLYKKARSGQLPGFTGIDQKYERPDNPELTVKTVGRSVVECVVDVLAMLAANNIVSTAVVADAERWMKERRAGEEKSQDQECVKELFVPADKLQQVEEQARDLPSLEVSTIELQWLQVI